MISKEDSKILGRLFLFITIIATALLIWKWDEVAAYLPTDQTNQNTAEITGIQSVKVITTPVQITTNDRVFEAVGTGRAIQSVLIYPAVSEEITAINFKAGDHVSEGQVLVQLDDRREKLAVQQAEVELADAKSLLARYQLAVKDGAVPESEVDSAQATVDIAEVALDQAKLALEERKVRAPFSGVVGLPRIDSGERLDPSTVITGLDDRSVILVDFDVPEQLSSMIIENQSILARTPAYPDQHFSGVINALESRIDPEKRTIKVRANFENQDDMLRPGMSFYIRLQIQGQEFPTVPEISVQWGRDGAFVWLIRDSVAHKTPIQVIARTSGDVLVKGDIHDQDQVVVEGLQRLQPGRPVEATLNVKPSEDSSPSLVEVEESQS